MQNEIVRFPHSAHDDQVDCLALIGRMLAGMTAGRMPPGAPPPGRLLTVGGSRRLATTSCATMIYWPRRNR